MLLSVNELIGYTVQSDDGDVGTLDDVLFDDATSKVRYHVIQAGGWLSDRRVLLPPAVVGDVHPENKTMLTGLTREEVRDSPPIDTDKPVSRQQEQALYSHYGWTPYWEMPLAAPVAVPYWGARPSAEDAAEAERGDPHLRSAREVLGYYIGANDGDIGHVEDLLIVEQDWIVQYLVIDTRNWLPGKKVLVATDWLTSVDWHEQKIAVDLARERIEASPEYDRDMTMNDDYEERLYRHYGRDITRT